MVAAATTIALWEEQRMSRDRDSGDGEEILIASDETAKELSIRAIQATIRLTQVVGELTATVEGLEKRLATDYEDAKTHELRTLKSRDKWFKGIVTAVVTAVAIAEVMHWLGLKGH